MTDDTSIAPCRVGITDADRAREADRGVLYGAILLARRPTTRIKPAIAADVQALLPAVQAFLNHETNDLAAYAVEYAQHCGAEAFLLSKRDQVGSSS